MPLDHAGKYHMNPEVARSHKGVATVPEHADPGAQEEEHGHPDIHHIEIHPHGDGTAHTVTHFHEEHPEHTPEGTRADHGSVEEAVHHIQSQIGEGPKEESDEFNAVGEEDESSEGDDEY